MAKVSYLNPSIAQTVSMLEDVLRRARKGEVEYVCAYAITKDDILAFRGGEVSGVDALTLVGHLEREKIFLFAQVGDYKVEHVNTDDERDR